MSPGGWLVSRQADLLDVERPEAFLDRDHHGPAVAGGQADVDSPLPCFWTASAGENRGSGDSLPEPSRLLATGLCAAACPSQPDGEAAEFQRRAPPEACTPPPVPAGATSA